MHLPFLRLTWANHEKNCIGFDARKMNFFE